MKCSRCGARGVLIFGHDSLCDSCRMKKWEQQRNQREALAEAEAEMASRVRHPAGRKLRVVRPYRRHDPSGCLECLGVKD